MKAEFVRSLGAEPVAADLFDSEAMRDAVSGCDAVLHIATKIPPLTRLRWKGAWKENDRLRREATRILVDAAQAGGVRTLVLESITFLYADGGDGWLDEESPVSLAWFSLDSMMDGERQAARLA